MTENKTSRGDGKQRQKDNGRPWRNSMVGSSDCRKSGKARTHSRSTRADQRLTATKGKSVKEQSCPRCQKANNYDLALRPVRFVPMSLCIVSCMERYMVPKFSSALSSGSTRKAAEHIMPRMKECCRASPGELADFLNAQRQRTGSLCLLRLVRLVKAFQ